MKLNPMSKLKNGGLILFEDGPTRYWMHGYKDSEMGLTVVSIDGHGEFSHDCLGWGHVEPKPLGWIECPEVDIEEGA